MRRFVLAFIGVLLLSSGRAEPPSPKPIEKPSRTETAVPPKWTIEDVVLSETASGFQLSPDGRWAVWVKTVMDKDKGETVANLVRTDLASRQDVELTRGTDSCTSPKWSPDGKRVAFLSTRAAPKKKADDKGKASADDEPKAQIWLIDPFGGEPWPLTDYPRGLNAFDWAGSEALVFVAPEEASHYETRTKDDRKDTSIVVEDEKHEPPARLFKVAVPSKKVTRLTDNTDRIENLAVSPDGRRAVTFHNHSLRFTFDNKVKPVVFLYDFENGERKQVFKDAKFNLSHVRWTRDSKGFYATDETSGAPQYVMASVTELYHYDLVAGAETKVDLGWERGLAAQGANDSAPGLALTPDGFLALLADGVHVRPARYVRDSARWRREWLTGEHAAHLFGFQTAADGKALVYAHSTASTPPQWYHARLDGTRLDRPRPIAAVNERLQDLPKARAEVVHWKGARDEEVEGILYYPHDYKPGQKRPLVVMIHGGPAYADSDAWDEAWYAPINLMCQRGAFVFKPNYHGSSGYGLKWLESIRDRYYELEVPDIEKGVDALIARGLVDPARLGVLGWSNGAILTIALTTTTTRYKAASAMAGDVDWVSDWANCEFGAAFDGYYLGKTPFEDPQLYWKISPFYRLDKVRTPTLIFFGAEDRVVATQQGWMHFRALQHFGKAPVRFLLFPGEKHGPKKLVHQRRKLEEELAWFDNHLFQGAKEENESLKADSPLAWALKRKAAKREGGRYGLVVTDRLIPETVTYNGRCLGRFEVTRAQFAEFDKTYPVPPGRENYPAAGIPFEQARAYCAWLSKHTGKTYRLPTEKEGEELYGSPEPGENTLNFWAGYAPNPDDAARLRDQARELGGGALLREVGSFHGSGDDAVFDLGGNVAEWVTTPDGKGRLMGGSADAPADAKQRSSQAAPEYRGFRVVRPE
jgi:dipeptidyl aminopeptidase/acylaminoacyl peptidase